MLRGMASDPAALFRTALSEWEKFANGVGGDMLRTSEWSRAMNGATGASLQGQAAFKGFMERALAAANIPSRTDVEDLSARMGRIEASLSRIEALLAPGREPDQGVAPRPTRGRRPPALAAD